MIKKLLAAFLIGVCGFGNAVFAQKENYIWYFGSQAGLNFNSGSPVALTNGSMYAGEGCSSISDSNGNLLFYTNGISVWDKNHIQMPNGDSLEGGQSSTQSALIVPMPGNNQLYYIFTVQQVFSPPHNFSYSIVDMSLNLANGDVTTKNNIIKSEVTEKLTAVKHSNGSDIYIMVHGYGNDSLFAYFVTGSGVLTTPVVSKIGQIITLASSDSGGYMKFSSDGTKLAFAAFGNNYVDLFDFNATTGLVTNEKYLSLPAANLGAYGLEFSRDGNYLYCAFSAPSHIFQWDITSNSDSIINSTLQQIGSSATLQLGALQMGPDGKIYVAKYQSTSFLGAINYPDSAGVSCNYVDSAVSLAGKTCGFGLPNFITSYFLPTGISTNDPQQNQLTISPNPATDKITISFAATTDKNVTIKMYCITGEVVYEKRFQSFKTLETLHVIDVSKLSNGIYFLSVQTDEKLMTKKIVVNH
jgi:hypothetical protein